VRAKGSQRGDEAVDAAGAASPRPIPAGIEEESQTPNRPADLRRIAAQTPERERKMLALAEQLEMAERGESAHRPDDALRKTRALAAKSATEALGIIVQQHVDVLFTDIVIPERDGIELAAKKLRPYLKLMFITGYVSRASEVMLLGPLLFKPLRVHQIEAALGDLAPGA
jgi:CheY-like chemotaxis protein